MQPFVSKTLVTKTRFAQRPRTLVLFLLTLLSVLPMSALAETGNKAKQCLDLYGSQKYYEAFPVCEKAAQSGSANAQFALAVSYYQGQGTLQDLNQAFNWMQQAANSGHLVAQYNLGLMFANGQGSEENFVSAYAWLKIASERGYEAAQQALEQLSGDLISEEITEGDQLAAKLRNQMAAQ